MTRNALLALIAVGLAACGSAGSGPTAKLTAPIPYQLDGAGVQLTDRPQRIDFGRTDHSTIPAMSKLVGQADTDRGICADGRPFVVWADGTTLYFSGGAFRGWSKSGAEGQIERAGQTCT